MMTGEGFSVLLFPCLGISRHREKSCFLFCRSVVVEFVLAVMFRSPPTPPQWSCTGPFSLQMPLNNSAGAYGGGFGYGGFSATAHIAQPMNPPQLATCSSVLFLSRAVFHHLGK